VDKRRVEAPVFEGANMRFNLLWSLSVVVPMVLLCLLLEPLTGELSAAFLSAGVTIACLLFWIEHWSCSRPTG
jgi:hypothetical protein